MIDIVVGIYPEWVTVHPRSVGNLCVKSQCDIHISIIPYPAMEGGRVRISRYYEICIREWIIAIGLNCVLGDSLNSEHEEGVDMDSF